MDVQDTKSTVRWFTLSVLGVLGFLGHPESSIWSPSIYQEDTCRSLPVLSFV